MRAALLTCSDVMQQLQPEWEMLWRRSSHATPFQSPAWLLSWWHVFGTKEPRVATLHAHDRLVGVLPMYILDEPPARKLLPIGAGISDYQDVLLDPTAGHEAARHLLQTVLAAAERDHATECTLMDIPPGSPLRIIEAPRAWREVERQAMPCPVLTLPPGTGGLDDVIPAGRLRDMRQSGHRADRRGGFSIEVGTDETLGPLLESVLSLHRNRWEPSEQLNRFFFQAAVALHACGALCLHVLRVGGTIAAAYYTLLASHRTLFYLSAFDPQFARESPGTILLGQIIQRTVGEHRHELHFLRGSEAYKYAWGAIDRPTMTRRLIRT